MKSLKRTISEDVRLRDEAIDSMNDELRTEFETILEEYTNNAKDTVRCYHRLGIRVGKIHKNYKTYGEGAVDKIAKGIMLDTSIVYKAKVFSEQFTTKELEEIFKKGDKTGNQVCWGHFIPLLTIAEDDQRAKLVDQIIEEGLSVRKLGEIIKELLHKGTITNRQQVPRSITGGLSQLTNMSCRLVQKMTSALEEAVFSPLFDLEDEKMDNDLLKRVSQAKDMVHQLADKADKRAEDLRQAEMEIQQVLERRATKKVEDDKKAEPAKEEAEKKKKERRPLVD